MQVADAPPCRLATLIYADSWKPALVWLAAHQSPDLLFQPIASARGAVGTEYDNPTGWRINLRHSAITYGLPTIMCNHCGTRDRLAFWGGSRMIETFDHELVALDDQPGLAIADIDPALTVRARTLLPTIRDADPALVHDLMRGGGLI